MKPKISEYNQNHPMTGYKRGETVVTTPLAFIPLEFHQWPLLRRMLYAFRISTQYFTFTYNAKYSTIQIKDHVGRIRFSLSTDKLTDNHDLVEDGVFEPTNEFLTDLYLTFKEDLFEGVIPTFFNSLHVSSKCDLQIELPVGIPLVHMMTSWKERQVN